MSIKIISKDFDCEIFDNFTICKLICEIQINDKELLKITLSDNNCNSCFKICEFENDDIDSLELFENCDEFDNLIEFAQNSKDEYLNKLLNDFENEFNSKYKLQYKDNIYLSDYQKQIFKNKENDYILKINHVSDNTEDKYYNISKDDFEINDNDDNNIIIEINESFDFDNEKISYLNYSI